MGLIPEETIREIRSRADIVAVIGQHVDLKKAGRNFKGLCPFHHEKTPSFNVNGDKGYYYCFGCQQKGDLFSFLMEFEGKSFVEAAESLASRFGVLIPDTISHSEHENRASQRAQLLKINQLAAKFFAGRLGETCGSPAKNYLEQRGIGAEQILAFDLGFAPNEWQSLLDFLVGTGGQPYRRRGNRAHPQETAR